MDEKISKDKAIQLARHFFKLPAEKEVYVAYLEAENDVQYWWVTFIFPAKEGYIYPQNEFLTARVNEATGKIEQMPSTL
jgi:hypothetical protein